MDRPRPIVLVVDDHYGTFRSLPALISSDAFSVMWVPDEKQGLQRLRDHQDDVMIVIVDMKSSGMGGGGFLHQAREIAPYAAFLITGPLGPFLYQGGGFYEFTGPSLKQEINTILFGIADEMTRNRKGKRIKGAQVKQSEKFGAIIGRSRSLNEIYRLIESLRNSSSTVLIQGESGTGKELVAQAIHRSSSREKHPFVAINCGAIPSNLIESELFGHERGAFTSAVNQRKGKFEIAHKGTLFLDEVAEISGELQVKLLRVLQEKEFQRVGGNKTLKTDVRVIAATSQDLKQAVKAGHFRDDLFYRLHVVPIHIPPLRERREDIPLLIAHFFRKSATEIGRTVPKLTEEAREALLAYSYPGNVRELINIIERLLVLCRNEQITFRDLPEEIVAESISQSDATILLGNLPDGGAPLRELEKELILKTLQKACGNKTATAKMLGITRRLLYLRLSQYNLLDAAKCHTR